MSLNVEIPKFVIKEYAPAVIREVGRCTRVVGCFPDGNSTLTLATAAPRHVAGTKRNTCRYLDMHRLRDYHYEHEER